MAEKKEIPLQQKVVIGVMALVGLVMFYSKVYSPLQGKINEAREQLKSKNTELSEMKKKAQQLDKLEKEFASLGTKLIETEAKLPKTEELPRFIRLITETASKYGMNVDNLKVEATSVSQYYVTHSYRFRLESDYHTFGKFFTEIVQMERIFNVKDIKFSPAASETGGEKLSAEFSVVAYTANQ